MAIQDRVEVVEIKMEKEGEEEKDQEEKSRGKDNTHWHPKPQPQTPDSNSTPPFCATADGLTGLSAAALRTLSSLTWLPEHCVVAVQIRRHV
jgi:hypothetical protein